jgi:two-component system cell cycle response regulator DivK
VDRERRQVAPEEAHVLVVEDNVANFVLVARLLAFAGIKNCEWKTTGWGVVEFAKTMPQVDLILMDLRLPHEDGYTALLQLRDDPQLADTAVVVITAQATAEEMAKAQSAGFDGFLGKPLDVDNFPDQIYNILRGEEIWDLGA